VVEEGTWQEAFAHRGDFTRGRHAAARERGARRTAAARDRDAAHGMCVDTPRQRAPVPPVYEDFA
jgi:hypothetical protein